MTLHKYLSVVLTTGVLAGCPSDDGDEVIELGDGPAATDGEDPTGGEQLPAECADAVTNLGTPETTIEIGDFPLGTGYELWYELDGVACSVASTSEPSTAGLVTVAMSCADADGVMHDVSIDFASPEAASVPWTDGATVTMDVDWWGEDIGWSPHILRVKLLDEAGVPLLIAANDGEPGSFSEPLAIDVALEHCGEWGADFLPAKVTYELGGATVDLVGAATATLVAESGTFVIAQAEAIVGDFGEEVSLVQYVVLRQP